MVDAKTDDIVLIDDEAHLDSLLESESHVLLDFHADWCGPCKMMAPRLESLAEETDATIAKVDVDVHPTIAARFDVSSIPTFIAFENGTVIERLIGVQESNVLADLVA